MHGLHLSPRWIDLPLNPVAPVHRSSPAGPGAELPAAAGRLLDVEIVL
ncbi:MAG: hypothetical protein ACLR0N_06485 [Bilophila wadsworthia]